MTTYLLLSSRLLFNILNALKPFIKYILLDPSNSVGTSYAAMALHCTLLQCADELLDAGERNVVLDVVGYLVILMGFYKVIDLLCCYVKHLISLC